jgi:hypothetical protein
MIEGYEMTKTFKPIFTISNRITASLATIERITAFLESKAAELGPFEEQWINGDTAANGFASLDALFKRLMAGGEV